MDFCPKANFPFTDNQWTKAFVGKDRELHAETPQSTLIAVFKLVVQWSDQCHMIVLSIVNLQSHFPEANSPNCGSLCHGYTLGINFFCLVGMSVSLRELTEYGSEYYQKT